MPAIRANIARLNGIPKELRTTEQKEELKTANRELNTKTASVASLTTRLEELRTPRPGGIEESKDEGEYQDPGESEDKFVYDAKLLYKNISEDAYYKSGIIWNYKIIKADSENLEIKKENEDYIRILRKGCW